MSYTQSVNNGLTYTKEKAQAAGLGQEQPHKKGPSLKQQTARGVKWLVISSFIQKALSFGTMVILARILNPSVFGLFALAFVAIDALGLFKSMGLDSALVQRKDNIKQAANTAFIVIPLLGVFLFLLVNISAPYIGKFLNNNDVVPVIQALALIFIFNCFNRVPRVLLEKEMRFAKIAFSETTSAVFYSCLAIALAFLGFGVWSLVIAYLAKTIVFTVFVWHFSNFKPDYKFDRKIAWQLFNFGKFVFLSSIIYFVRMNLDNLLVGKLLGITALGIYALSYGISNILIYYFSRKVEGVMYPAYAKKQDNNEILKKSYLEILKITSFIALPYAFAIYFLSKEIVYTIYGSKWMGAVPIIQILVWVGLIRAFSTSLVSIFMAKGKPQYEFWFAALQTMIFLVFIIPLSRFYGLRGIAYAVTISTILNTLFIFILFKKMVSLKIIEIYSKIKVLLYATLIMTIVILLAKWLLSDILLISNTYAVCFITSFLSLISYTFFVFKLDRQFVLHIKSLLFTG